MYWDQKIFINDKPLILTTDKEAYMHDHPEAAGYNIFMGATIRNFDQAMHRLDRPGIQGVIVEDNSEKIILDELAAWCRPIDAAGGVAFNERGEVLLIYRRGKWDLPKGKRDEDEDMETCALREVKEETGLVHVTLGDKICDTYHIYAQYGDQLLKRTSWYRMSALSTDKLKPQKEENIMEARWVQEAHLGTFLSRTYEAIIEVLDLAGLKTTA